MENIHKKTRLAVVGAGGFAHFAVTRFVENPGIQLIGVYDEVRGHALRFKEIVHDLKVYDSLNELYSDSSIDLVYIATPPYLHYVQSKGALLAGKHVICEKPAAITLQDAVELRALTRKMNLLFVVNLMQRYNPLYDSVKHLIEENVLGRFLHGFFENYASDEFLPEQHWFWDPKKSGGIFIEHGVHFFDMFEGWFGEGKVIASQKITRPGYPEIRDKFQATVLYGDALVNFYHGFDQPKVLDRQEMRLQFERGEVTLYEWVPTSLKINAICDENQLRSLQSIFPHSEIAKLESFDKKVSATGGFKEIVYQFKVCLHTPDTVQKTTLYGQLLTSMLADQLAWIHDNSHARKIDANNAVTSLQIATEAESLAAEIGAT
jgi:predicted dehydrogenase